MEANIIQILGLQLDYRLTWEKTYRLCTCWAKDVAVEVGLQNYVF
jgi:hypothetical protein